MNFRRGLSSLSRSLVLQQVRQIGCHYRYSTKPSAPLRILYCGSDEFSIVHLRALAEERLQNTDIESIDIVHKRPKPFGRGLKTLREAPIHSVAQELNLPIHEIDTFTGWNLPSRENSPINFIIAVSFGLKIPSRILNQITYGGWNVHPSLLPDLRGPAPILRALLLGREVTGVTLQTLHPKFFDQGEILAQTPPPGIPIPDKCSPTELQDMLAKKGAKMLVTAIREKLYLQELPQTSQPTNAQLAHASKITKEDHHIHWPSWDVDKIIRYNHVLGQLWSTVGPIPTEPVVSTEGSIVADIRFLVPIETSTQRSWELASSVFPKNKRIIFHNLVPVRKDMLPNQLPPTDPGTIVWVRGGNKEKLYVRAWQLPESHSKPDFSGYLEIGSCTMEGGKKGRGTGEILNHLEKWVSQRDSSG